jgi:disulfide bond formation protein DsbB
MTTSELDTSSRDWLEALYDDREADSSIRRVPFRCVVNGLGFLLCVAILSLAYYLQYAKNLQPCPLCTFQRLVIAVMGVVFLASALWNPGPRAIRNGTTMIVTMAVLGLVAAGYQVWLQAQTTFSPAYCLPPLNYLLAAFPPAEALKIITSNPVGCNEISWTFLGLSFPAWNGMGFAVLGALALSSHRESQ